MSEEPGHPPSWANQLRIKKLVVQSTQEYPLSVRISITLAWRTDRHIFTSGGPCLVTNRRK